MGGESSRQPTFRVHERKNPAGAKEYVWVLEDEAGDRVIDNRRPYRDAQRAFEGILWVIRNAANAEIDPSPIRTWEPET